MTGIYYSEEHEYIRIDGDTGTVGITDFAQKALGDVVYVELPPVGAVLARNTQAGVVESVKSASEIYTPVSGEIVAINDAVINDTALVNTDPENAAWFFKIKLADPTELDGLKDAASYQRYTEGL